MYIHVVMLYCTGTYMSKGEEGVIERGLSPPKNKIIIIFINVFKCIT